MPAGRSATMPAGRGTTMPSGGSDIRQPEGSAGGLRSPGGQEMPQVDGRTGAERSPSRVERSDETMSPGDDGVPPGHARGSTTMLSGRGTAMSHGRNDIRRPHDHPGAVSPPGLGHGRGTAMPYSRGAATSPGTEAKSPGQAGASPTGAVQPVVDDGGSVHTTDNRRPTVRPPGDERNGVNNNANRQSSQSDSEESSEYY